MTNKHIPIFIHHETGEKPQAGKDNKQQYLKYCIQQAEKYGNEVYLFGDNANKTWASNWIDVKSINSNKWENFLIFFENFSTYPDAWAKGIFHRFFIFEEYAKKHSINSFFVLDSDILVYDNLESVYDWETIDFAAIMPYSNQLGNEIDNELRWTINAGVSFWSISAISSFTSFCVDVYEKHKDILMPKWEFHKKYSYPGGIGEMSLLYLWNNNNQKLKFLNLCCNNFKGGIFNSDINGSENYKKKEFKCSTILGTKKLQKRNEEIYMTTLSGERIKVYNLHFGGDAKMLMKDYFENGRLKPKTYIIYAAYNFKKRIGNSVRKIKRMKNRIYKNIR